MEELLNGVESGSQQVSDMVDAIVGDKTKEIDEFIERVREMFLSDKEMNDGEIDRIMLQIPVYIYYLTRILQDIDIRKGVSLENAKFYENEQLLLATGTVAEKQAKANNSTIKNRVVSLAYKSATALVQGKMNAAMEILSSAKRVQQRRLEEMKLTKMAGNSVATF